MVGALTRRKHGLAPCLKSMYTPCKVVGVMHKDAKRYAATGGWGFEGFDGGDATNRVVGENAASACFACHAPQENTDYIFSQLRD